MPLYKFLCKACKTEFESIEKIGTEQSTCPKCCMRSGRMHGQELPSPAQIEVGVGGVYKGKFGERKF